MAKGRTVCIDAGRIEDWDTFHAAFAEAFGFPDWYGRNMNAWIDLMTSLDEDQATTDFFVQPGEIVTIDLRNAAEFRSREPELYAAIIECAAFVNWRRIEQGGTPYLCLAFSN